MINIALYIDKKSPGVIGSTKAVTLNTARHAAESFWYSTYSLFVRESRSY